MNTTEQVNENKFCKNPLPTSIFHGWLVVLSLFLFLVWFWFAHVKALTFSA